MFFAPAGSAVDVNAVQKWPGDALLAAIEELSSSRQFVLWGRVCYNAVRKKQNQERFMMKLEELRQEFPLTEELTYLDHAATSPLPGRTRAAMTKFIEARRLVRQAWDEL